jgi:hypothetical protein
LYTLFSYFLVLTLSQSSSWAIVWLVNDADMTSDGCPVAQPRFKSLPSARIMTECPSWKVNLSTWGLILILWTPGYFLRPS